ncbi:hypothetical protein [Streptomyces sp. NPDC057854]|uniref:hypothetical protein n=1 Tax=unclassified Streptomyces TaxID=2593676 RepID=UPI0036BFE2F0
MDRDNHHSHLEYDGVAFATGVARPEQERFTVVVQYTPKTTDGEQTTDDRLLAVVRAFVTTHAPWKPLFIGAVITGDNRMRLYFRSPERDRTYGVDVLASRTGPGLLGALISPAFLANEHLHQPSDDPHCDTVVDLTDY